MTPDKEAPLFEEIAFAQGYCTMAQIEECVLMRTLGETDAEMEEILLFQGYVSAAQHAQVLQIAQWTLRGSAPVTRAAKEAALFGRLSVREGLLSQAEVEDCLGVQARVGRNHSLGEIMVSQGYLTQAQVTLLLRKQQRRLMSCPICRLTFRVLTITPGKPVCCPRCRTSLLEGKTAGRSLGNTTTAVLPAVQGEVVPAPRPLTRVLPSSGLKVDTLCGFCGSVFKGAVDSSGRHRCPSCHKSTGPL